MKSSRSTGVVEQRIHVSLSAMMSDLWLSVGSLSAVTCFSVEHGADIEGADEKV